MKKAHTKVIFFSFITVTVMFGFCFAAAPLYSKLCKSIDLYAGQRIPAGTLPDVSRALEIQLVTNNNQNLPWLFYAKHSALHLHPNENVRTVFFAKNNTSKTMTVQAIPSITPPEAAKHLHKTECFCFSQQTLKAGESINMPVVFHIDENLPRSISIITLSYTLFDITNKSAVRKNNG